MNMTLKNQAHARLEEMAIDASLRACDIRLGASRQELKLNATGADMINAQRWRARNALSPETGGSGGFIDPTTSAGEIIQIRLGDASCIRRECTVVPGTTLVESYPFLDDGQTEGRQVGAGQGAIETDPAFVARNSFGHKYSSDKITAPHELLRDAPRLTESLLSALARRVGRRQNRAFTVGTGANEPLGLATGCTVGVTTAATTAIAINELIDLQASVDAEYTHDGMDAFMLHPLMLAILRKVTDGQGRNLWRESGLGDERIILNMHMPASIVAGTPAVLWGNFKRAYVVRELETRFITLTETYVEADQVGFELLQVADGFISDPDAVKSLVIHA